MMKKWLIMGLGIITLIFIPAIHAQQLCEALVKDTLESVQTNCEDASNETACYGNDTLSAFFIDDTLLPDAFDTPADLVDFVSLGVIQSTGIDLEADEWGMSHLQTRATLPEDAPDTDRLVIIMMGAVSLESVGLENGIPRFNFIAQSGSPCIEAPNTVIMQAPLETDVQVIVNDIPVQIGSTVAFGFGQDDADADVLWTTTLSGDATLYYDSTSPVNIPNGYYSYAYPTARWDSAPVTTLNGDELMTTWGIPFVRRVPQTAFITPEPLRDMGTDFRSLDFYTTIYALPESILNYPLSTEVASCNIIAKSNITDLRAHVGPGRERGVRAFLDITQSHLAVGQAIDRSGNLWYVIRDEQFGNVWVSASDLQASCGELAVVPTPILILLPTSTNTPTPTATPTQAPLGIIVTANVVDDNPAVGTP